GAYAVDLLSPVLAGEYETEIGIPFVRRDLGQFLATRCAVAGITGRTAGASGANFVSVPNHSVAFHHPTDPRFVPLAPFAQLGPPEPDATVAKSPTRRMRRPRVRGHGTAATPPVPGVAGRPHGTARRH